MERTVVPFVVSPCVGRGRVILQQDKSILLTGGWVRVQLEKQARGDICDETYCKELAYVVVGAVRQVCGGICSARAAVHRWSFCLSEVLALFLRPSRLLGRAHVDFFG